MKNQVWRSADSSHDVLRGTLEDRSRIAGNLGKNEMKVDSGLDTVFLLVMDIADPDVLLENPENPFKLPTIADDVSQRDGLHARVRTEVNLEIPLMDKGNHDDGGVQRWHVDGIPLEFDPLLPTKGPAGPMMREEGQAGEVANIGGDRPAHFPSHYL